MQTTLFMISMKGTQKLFDNILDMLPISRRSSSVSPFVLGAIGVAVVGGIAAVMILSPRTRYRVLGAAKDTYGKVASSDIGHRLGLQGENEIGGMQQTQPNGAVPSYGVSTGI